jgi:plasmid replication initiation protein
MPEEGSIEIKFAEKIIPFLSQLEGSFTKYSLSEISNFKSVYGIRLYEMILQWKNSKKSISLKVKDLRKRFQLREGQYKLFKDFRVYCIEKGVKDINSYSSYQITKVDYLKTGRSITGIDIHFCLKSELKKKNHKKKINQELSRICEDLDKPKKLKKIFSEETQPIFKLAPSD